MRRPEASWELCMGSAAEWPRGFAGGEGVMNEAMEAVWLGPPKREREGAGARGAGAMTVGETDGTRSGLPSKAQHRCGGQNPQWMRIRLLGRIASGRGRQ
jgi:hypothetical protein